LAIAEELSMRPLLGLCYLGLGRVAEHTGNRARAEEYVRTALALFRAMDLGVWLVRAEAALARVLEQPMVAKSDGIARILFVVSRDELPLYNQLTREFVGKDNIRVVLDRRTGERTAQRSKGEWASVERRCRTSLHVRRDSLSCSPTPCGTPRLPPGPGAGGGQAPIGSAWLDLTGPRAGGQSCRSRGGPANPIRS